MSIRPWTTHAEVGRAGCPFEITLNLSRFASIIAMAATAALSISFMRMLSTLAVGRAVAIIGACLTLGFQVMLYIDLLIPLTGFHPVKTPHLLSGGHPDRIVFIFSRELMTNGVSIGGAGVIFCGVVDSNARVSATPIAAARPPSLVDR
jgi:hypothetical protein